MWENKYEAVFLTRLILVAMSVAQPQTLPMHRMGVGAGGVLFSFLPLAKRLVGSCLLLRMLLSGFFLSPSLDAHHAFPCHVPLVECLNLLALSYIPF